MNKLTGVLLLTFVFLLFITIREGLSNPLYSILVYISIICLSVCLYRDSRRLMTTPVIYLFIMLFYLILSLGKEIGIRTFSCTMALILLIYLFYLTRELILIIPFAILIYFLVNLIIQQV